MILRSPIVDPAGPCPGEDASDVGSPVSVGLKKVGMESRSYLIVGAGHFGNRAARELLKKDPCCRITVVDRKGAPLERLSGLPIQTALGEGRSFLGRFLAKKNTVDFVVPAVPFHFAFEYLLRKLRPLGARRGRIPCLPGLPNAVRGKSGDLYTSLADFLCPESCPAPSRYCWVTGKRRVKPLYRILEELEGPFESEVIRSEQLGPGVGGFRLKRLLDLQERIERRLRQEQQGLLLLSTASRCHGVTSCLSWQTASDLL